MSMIFNKVDKYHWPTARRSDKDKRVKKLQHNIPDSPSISAPLALIKAYYYQLSTPRLIVHP